ncbi:hypothetical protein PYK79_46450 [Streptomyces sp. ID05-04B]|uniref:hypothetical protein n=1 Tax=Streptomyces sp. ID05-04B TaxID=3028661 RepID=UPI0029C5D54F|nr:hypothetical protein [Streptomyces sp. ID05-04B]MDX5569248.1 hypothetical protein [Streptomyces sp. ID05-04B]
MDKAEIRARTIALLTSVITTDADDESFAEQIGDVLEDAMTTQGLMGLVSSLTVAYRDLAMAHDAGDPRPAQEILQELAVRFSSVEDE